jgi:hypothetical protein
MYHKRIDDLFVMMNNMMEKEKKLDQKCSDLSRLCRTLLDAVRDVMKHDSMGYDERKAKKEAMMEIFAYLQNDGDGDIKVMKQCKPIGKIVDHG